MKNVSSPGGLRGMGETVEKIRLVFNCVKNHLEPFLSSFRIVKQLKTVMDQSAHVTTLGH